MSLLRRICLFTLIATTGLQATPTENGLYAVFDTNKGEFTAELYYELAPLSCANFVGLAEGTLPHYEGDSDTPVYSKFYDGLIFHRVIEDFVIQSGDPLGTGAGGPGYQWLDEVRPELKHNAEGILSMANAGTNTNGSQFFVTLADDTATHLNGIHNVFGKVVEGIQTVRTIGGVETDDETGKPLQTVRLESVSILRIGDEANAFDPTFYANRFNDKLPLLGEEFESEIEIKETEAGTLEVAAPLVALADYRLLTSDDPRADLEDWTEIARFPPSLDPEAEVSYALSEIDPFESKFYRLTSTIGLTTDVDGLYEKIEITSGSGDSTYVETITFNDKLIADYKAEDGETIKLYYDWLVIGSDRVQLVAFLPNNTLYIQYFLTKETETSGKVYIRQYNIYGQLIYRGEATYTLKPAS